MFANINELVNTFKLEKQKIKVVIVTKKSAFKNICLC